MIIVNTPGNGSVAWGPLPHAHWNGFTPRPSTSSWSFPSTPSWPECAGARLLRIQPRRSVPSVSARYQSPPGGAPTAPVQSPAAMRRGASRAANGAAGDRSFAIAVPALRSPSLRREIPFEEGLSRARMRMAADRCAARRSCSSGPMTAGVSSCGFSGVQPRRNGRPRAVMSGCVHEEGVPPQRVAPRVPAPTTAITGDGRQPPTCCISRPTGHARQL
jgi:hypothetical protein